jgi:hypothetical protein
MWSVLTLGKRALNFKTDLKDVINLQATNLEFYCVQVHDDEAEDQDKKGRDKLK